jgi:hypothetical protein
MVMEQVEIRVKGLIDESWSKWLENLSITHSKNGETILTGLIRDQAALYGVLEKVYSLGIRLLSVSCENKPVLIKEDRMM